MVDDDDCNRNKGKAEFTAQKTSKLNVVLRESSSKQGIPFSWSVHIRHRQSLLPWRSINAIKHFFWPQETLTFMLLLVSASIAITNALIFKDIRASVMG